MTRFFYFTNCGNSRNGWGDHHSAIFQGTLPDVQQPADFGGFLYDSTQQSLRDMPTVTQTLYKLPTLPMD
jgi:hypothetical protein